MNIVEYINKNWANLPKSTFNDDEVVIFKCDEDYDGGWGHHNYDGWGVNVEGDVCYCFSSGCSCGGSCCAEVKDFKVLATENVSVDVDWKDVDFKNLEVHYSDY